MPSLPTPTPTRGIPTLYAGTEFRSRLEARWGAMFDLFGIPWIYEPFDGDGYIPDFLIHSATRPVLVEVKPATTEADYRAPIQKILDGIGDRWSGHDAVVLGVSPIAACNLAGVAGYGPVAGLYIDWLGGRGDWHTSTAWWFQCGRCNLTGINPDTWSLKDCPGCGTHGYPVDVTPDQIDAAWRTAGNLVKWQPK